MQSRRLYHVCMSLCSYMMCFEGSGRLMEEEKSPITLNGTLILSFLPWIFRLCIYPPSWVCNVLMHSPHGRGFQPYVGHMR